MSARIAPESLVGTELSGTSGRFRITQYLTSGGLAHVYLARGYAAGSAAPLVALKVLKPELDERREAVTRFEREAIAALRVRHENVISILGDVERSGGLTFFYVEHLVGVDLADLLSSQKRLAAGRAVRVLSAVGRGVAAAHEAGVIHRDIKPENLFLVHASDGREIPKLLDFGSAWVDGDAAAASQPNQRITVSTGFVGTPGYVAPEQAEGAVAGSSADVYSLGVVLFEALTGNPPYKGRNWIELIHLHSTAPIPLVRDVSPALLEVVRTALGKKPDQRFPSVNAMLAALAATPEACKA